MPVIFRFAAWRRQQGRTEAHSNHRPVVSASRRARRGHSSEERRNRSIHLARKYKGWRHTKEAFCQLQNSMSNQRGKKDLSDLSSIHYHSAQEGLWEWFPNGAFWDYFRLWNTILANLIFFCKWSFHICHWDRFYFLFPRVCLLRGEIKQKEFSHGFPSCLLSPWHKDLKWNTEQAERLLWWLGNRCLAHS